ncbi:hypothetical protein [Janibacter cremeus]|uniref:Hsp70 family protein n=1 Tax=Janibacter cremeus TaxID=1285192 RepID=A0A852VN08_9MICO|nr:hypothetical protein [Janibacter cremeus]NYF97319.1 hypothetical protein [Janibacter cremeus]
MTIGTAEVCAIHMTRSSAGAAQPASELVRKPLAVVDELGTPTPAGASGAQSPAVDGLLARVGDPVPVRVGSRSWPAETLVAVVIADAAAAVADEPAEHLVLVVPDEWRAHRRAALRDAVVGLTEQSVTMVDAGLGIVDQRAGEHVDGPVLVLAAGDESFRAHTFIHGDDGWRVTRTSCSDWGGNDIDDALLDFVGDRSPSVPAKGAHDAFAVRAACTNARADLAQRTATEVDLPGRDPVRLVRADLELLAGGAVTDIVDQLVADVIDPNGVRPAKVLVTGSLASLPMVVEAVSGALGMSVTHVTDGQALQRYADAGAAAMESSTVAEPADTDGHDVQDTQLLPIAPLPPARHQGHRRRTAVLVAAALAVAAPVAAVAMTMTDAGEATLLSLVDGVVPQDSSSPDRANSDVLGSLADAAMLPALPWGDSNDADDDEGNSAATGDTGESAEPGGGTADDGTKSPSPTSTHGDPAEKKKDKDSKDREESKKGKKKSDETGKKDKGKASESKTARGNGSDKASPSKSSSSKSSSSKAKTPNTPSKSSGHTPSSPNTPSSTSGTPANPTTSPSTSTPAPTKTPDPEPSTTPDPDPTPDPEPSTSTPTSSEPSVTSSPSTTATAPATSEQTTSPAPGQS